jgi:hypothetical protein
MGRTISGKEPKSKMSGSHAYELMFQGEISILIEQLIPPRSKIKEDDFFLKTIKYKIYQLTQIIYITNINNSDAIIIIIYLYILSLKASYFQRGLSKLSAIIT